jgi:hypothetical protein
VHKFAFGLCITLALSGASVAQQTSAVPSASLNLPDAPLPQYAAATESSSSSAEALPEQTPTAQTPSPTGQEDTAEQRRAKAAEQLKEEETQRMAGIIPNFMAVNNGKALPITPKQKFQLFFKGAFDSYQFVLAGIDAGIGQAEDTNYGYHGGIKGFARRYGANFADNFDGNFWGNAVLPSLLHQDPRYFRMGHGTVLHRSLYSISTTFRTRGDNGNWQPAYSNLVGNFIGAAISNVYYPDYRNNERGIYPTLRRGIDVTYQGTIGGLLEEFYPDLQQLLKNAHERKLARQAEAAASVPAP